MQNSVEMFLSQIVKIHFALTKAFFTLLAAGDMVIDTKNFCH